MAEFRWNPLSWTFDLDRQIDQAFAELIYKPWGRLSDEPLWQPAIDIYETPDEYLLVADLPGVAPSDVEVKVESHGLVICGTRYGESAWRLGRTVHVEREHGGFFRKVALEHEVDACRVESNWERGLLMIHLPKLSKASKHRGLP